MRRADPQRDPVPGCRRRHGLLHERLFRQRVAGDPPWPHRRSHRQRRDCLDPQQEHSLRAFTAALQREALLLRHQQRRAHRPAASHSAHGRKEYGTTRRRCPPVSSTPRDHERKGPVFIGPVFKSTVFTPTRRTIGVSLMASVTLLGVSVLTALGPAGPAAAADTASINGAATFQTMAGFGASEGFGQAGTIENAASATQTQALNYLFSPTSGAGLTILRNRKSV